MARFTTANRREMALRSVVDGIVSGRGAVKAIAIMLLILALAGAIAGDLPIVGMKPRDGFVPNAKTAIKIAVAVWEPIYGEQTIANEKPYRARLLTNTVWKVEGSLPHPVTSLGGVATAFIAKEDGRIINVYHTR